MHRHLSFQHPPPTTPHTRMLPLHAYGVALTSMLAGASVVHYFYKPDLTIPGYEAPETKR